MKIGQLLNYLEAIAPLSYQESYDNAGLIVGDRSTEITGVLICLDSLESILEEAEQEGCNLIIAHHPIVFGGLKRFNGRSYVERVVMKAIQKGIAIYAAHTNLDNVYVSGVNAKIAERLGLENTRILAPKSGLLRKLYTFVPKNHLGTVRDAVFKAGAGHIGNYSECSFASEGEGTFRGNAQSNPVVGQRGERHVEAEFKIEFIFPAHLQGQIIANLLQAHPYEEVAYDVVNLANSYQRVGSGMVGELAAEMPVQEFLQFLKTRMQTACVRYTKAHKETIKRVAVCGGAGSFLLKSAIRAKADIFITGDYKYHQFFDADSRIIIADIGHYESEQFTIELFYELITQKFTNFKVLKTKVNTNPINYL
ncbi:MAG: Nif3-like dinuclear metal center hexameric protein [Saprospiraceae bacterium]|nr:Nif3-like dinuclear metal center hexameric protein [Saprospiraceae bacterium]